MIEPHFTAAALPANFKMLDLFLFADADSVTVETYDDGFRSLTVTRHQYIDGHPRPVVQRISRELAPQVRRTLLALAHALEPFE